jgi:hypothetical protein
MVSGRLVARLAATGVEASRIGAAAAGAGVTMVFGRLVARSAATGVEAIPIDAAAAGAGVTLAFGRLVAWPPSLCTPPCSAIASDAEAITSTVDGRRDVLAVVPANTSEADATGGGIGDTAYAVVGTAVAGSGGGGVPDAGMTVVSTAATGTALLAAPFSGAGPAGGNGRKIGTAAAIGVCVAPMEVVAASLARADMAGSRAT